MKDDFKKFDFAYKRIRVYGSGDIKDAETLAKRIKFFRFDMLAALGDLEEVVLEEKAGAEPIKATKIEDYISTSKVIRGLLKDAKWHRDKLDNACKELEKLPKNAEVIASSKKLKDLKKDIDSDLKTRDKKDKLRPPIEKLQKQIETDLKVSDDILATFKKIPDSYYKANEAYDPAIRAIMIAKPRLSAKTQKYNALAPQKLKKGILLKTIKQCEGLGTAVSKAAELALNAAKEGKTKEGITHWQKGTKELQKVQKIVNDYLVIQKKFKNEIDKSFDKKVIENSIKKFEKILLDTEKQWADASAEIKKAAKA